jgi:hypothetical protein
MKPVPIDSLRAKLHPSRFTEMSPKMAALVAYILETDYDVHPRIKELAPVSGGIVLARTSMDIGYNLFIGSEDDLVRNWKALLNVAGLTVEERLLADSLFSARVYGMAA